MQQREDRLGLQNAAISDGRVKFLSWKHKWDSHLIPCVNDVCTIMPAGSSALRCDAQETPLPKCLAERVDDGKQWGGLGLVCFDVFMGCICSNFQSLLHVSFQGKSCLAHASQKN